MLKPDIEMTQRFLDILGPGEEFTFQTFADKKNQPGHAALGGCGARSLSRVFHGTLGQHATTLEELNAAGAGIFVMVNAGDGKIHNNAKTCRTNANVIRIRALFVDLDGAPLAPVESHNPAPTIVVESSPGRFHGYWRLDGCAVEDFKPSQQALATMFGGDPSVCDLSRVMRLPGFYHLKREPSMTKLSFPQG